MKIGMISPMYNEEALVSGCIRCYAPFVERHIVCLSEKPYYGQPFKKDRTRELAEDLGAYVVSGGWRYEHEQRNVAVKLLSDMDWILVSDADMWMDDKTIEGMLSVLSETNGEAFVMPQYSYWHDVDHILDGDDFAPVVAIRPHVRFIHIGNVNTGCIVLNQFRLHHLNWCAPKNILQKVMCYSHAPEFDGEKWYHDKFVNWKYPDPAVMPDGKVFNVLCHSLPERLRCYLS